MATSARKKTKKPRRVLRKIIITLVVLLVLGAVALSTYDRLRQEYTVTYDTYNATIGTISNSLSFSGTLQLVNEKTYTSSSSSTVRSIAVRAGDSVQAGDLLLRLSNGKSFTADFAGRVNTLSVDEGDEVSNGQELMQLADFDHMKVSIRVDEYDISDVRVGQACRITTTATEQSFDSSIDSINYISSSTGSVAYYTATAYTDVPAGIYPGMQVTVTIPQEEASNVVILKMDALSFDQTNRAFVYMMDGEGQMQQIPVTTGVSNGNYVEIKSGLQANDTVYAVTKTETASTMASMFSSLFGGQRINNNTRNFNRQNNNTNQNPGNFNPGSNGGGPR